MAPPTSSATILMVSISAADQSRSARQSSKPMMPRQRPSAKIGTLNTDLMEAFSNNARAAGSKSRVWPAIVSPRASRGIHDASPASAIGIARLAEFLRRWNAGHDPQAMLDDFSLVAAVEHEDMHAVDAGGRTDLLGHFRQGRAQVGRRQQLARRVRDRFQQRVAPAAVERRQCFGEFIVVRPRRHLFGRAGFGGRSARSHGKIRR